jgi:insertion element IS1 protein InsB
VLELDELWSCVLKKTKQAWIWIALCRKTRQVVAYAVGDRSEQTCRRLWEAIPHAYRTGACYTDFWAAYQAVLPEEQHTAVGKETGETAHVERWNNTLRQRLARFVRKTLSFSKSLLMHDQLVDNGYLLSLPVPVVRGKAPFVYTLARKRLNYLKAAGVDVRDYFRPSK